MLICITGMHRSGTSLTAAWLHACGLTLADQTMLPPTPDNPRGFYEDIEFFHLHRQSIARRNPRNHGWKVTPGQALDFSTEEVDLARRLVAARQAKYADWGWKDPRTLLFLPTWKALLPELKVLVVWRPCDQVVWSLLRRWWRNRAQRRYYTGLFGAIRLWLTYNRLAIAFAQAHPQDTLVLAVEQQIVRADQDALALINRHFGTALTYTPIKTIYETRLLHLQPTPPPLPWLCAAAGCRQLEARLQRLTVAVDE